jgi:hypothetical protein
LAWPIFSLHAPDSKDAFIPSRIRIHSTKALKLLGTLAYHKESCQAIRFARTYHPRLDELQENQGTDDDDMEDSEKEARGRWVISGGKDGRIAIWELGTFERGESV